MSVLFLLALGKIIWIDILLSGDNALVIAMAVRALEPPKRMIAILIGMFFAVMLRIGATAGVAILVLIPYLKLAGGAFLAWIAISMVAPDDAEADHPAPTTLLRAIGTVIMADFIMSLDNMVAVGAAANGNLLLLTIGLALSIPLIITGATVISKILDRFPILMIAGGALLAWIAGGLIATDPLIENYNSNTMVVTGVVAALIMTAALLSRYAIQESDA